MTRFNFANPIVSRFMLSVLLTCATLVAQAKRNDVVIMKNGDHLSGEVKKLEGGILYLDTPYTANSIELDWLQVESVQSTGSYQIVLKDGQHLAGAIAKVPSNEAPDKDFTVRLDSKETETAGRDVVNIESRKPNFWRQLTGKIDFGYDFTSGNSQTSLSSDASASYSATKWNAGASFTSSFSGQSAGSKTNLLELEGLSQRYMRGNSSLTALVDFLHSSQQNLQLRTTLGGGYGRFVFRTNQNHLSWVAGAVFTNETFTSTLGQPTDQNIEGLLGGQYQLLRFSRYNLESQALVFPGLSDAGRIRATTNTTFNVKLSNNFYTNFSFWDNYDSRPPVSAKKNELGISSGLGWTF